MEAGILNFSVLDARRFRSLISDPYFWKLKM